MAGRMTKAMSPVARLSIAPMMDWTDRHYRYLMRLITKHTLLYTEMVVDQTLLHQRKNLDYFLGHDATEAPLAVQLGGNSVEDLGVAAKICQDYGGFCEINLNTGCPSSTVSKRCFGAKLMLDPDLVRDICNSMQSQLEPSEHKPEVTVKCRLGVDDHDSYEELHHFVSTVASAGITHFIVHARKCWLKGLSPHENRTVPPLQYERVYKLKEDFPHLYFSLNGGVSGVDHALELLKTTPVDGVMIGRAAYNFPWKLRDADTKIFGAAEDPNFSRREIIATYLDYAEKLQAEWGADKPLTDVPYTMPTSELLKPLLTLFAGEHGGKAFKREIAKQWGGKDSRPALRDMVYNAIKVIPDDVLDARANDVIEEQAS